MKKLEEADVLRIMREEWDAKVKKLTEEVVDVVMTAKTGNGDEKTIISPDLKIRHKKSNILYTVSSVGPRDVILRTPEGEEFLVDASEIEQEYALD